MCECVCVEERKEGQEGERQRAREFGDLCVWTYTVYIHVFLRIGITYIRHKRL